MMKILGIGNALLDVLLMLESDETLARLGMEKGVMDLIDERRMLEIHRAQAGLKRNEAPGGSVCNTMRALAALGAEAGYVGKIGSDNAGRFYEQAVRQAGVTPCFVRVEGISGCSTVLISPDGERTMATFLGPAAMLSADEITDDTLCKYDCVYVEGYLISNDTLFLPILQRIRRLGLKIALNLSNFNVVDSFIELWRRVIPEYVDILFANGSEAKSYTGLDAENAIGEILKQVDTAVVTIGEKGALAGSGNTRIHVPAPACTPIDTTGAGDNFAAGFLYGLSAGASLEQSARIGTLLSGHVIETVGPQIPAGSWDEIKLKVNEYVGQSR
ncbi:MAG: adenosine kinase [Tannerella sp.]|nr:adenosine kinase [Tannerella sp.]